MNAHADVGGERMAEFFACCWGWRRPDLVQTERHRVGGPAQKGTKGIEMNLRMNCSLLASAFVVMSAIACGDDPEPSGGKDAGDMNEPEDDAGTEPEDLPATRTASGTLVAITATDTSAPIKIPHKIVVLDAETDEPLGPKFQTMTSASDGTWEIKDIPRGRPTSLHIQGTATDGTYDSVLTNVTVTTADDALTRISSASTASVAGILSGFTPAQDKSALTVGVYHVRNKKRLKVIGCTQAWLDDDPSQPPKEGDLRYVGAGGLPTPISVQDRTEVSRGAMLFANIAKGKHTIKLSVDGGKTFFGKTEFFINKARQDSTSEFKGILYQLGIELPEDMTPPNCK
jgi:hypothetical protein